MIKRHITEEYRICKSNVTFKCLVQKKKKKRRKKKKEKRKGNVKRFLINLGHREQFLFQTLSYVLLRIRFICNDLTNRLSKLCRIAVNHLPHRRSNLTMRHSRPTSARYTCLRPVSFIIGQRGGILFFLFFFTVRLPLYGAPFQRIFFRACECGTTTVKGIRFTATRYRSIVASSSFSIVSRKWPRL